MGKRIFWIFILVVSLATASAVGYIQSESFAKIVREKLQASVVRNLGVELGFDRLKIGVLPPSISLVNVDLKVSDRQNKLGLSPSTVFRAGTLGFSFRMIQAFSNGIAVNKLFLGDAQVKLTLPKSKESSGGEKLSAMVQRPIHFQIMKGFEASIRQLEIRNSDVELSGASEEFYLRVKKIAYLAITPAAEGTNLVANLEDAEFSNNELKESIKAFKANVDAQKNLVLFSSVDIQRREAALHAAGKLVGSIDRILDAKADLDLILRSPLRELSDFEKGLSQTKGELLADAKVVGLLKNPAVQGRLEISNFVHDLWSMDKIELNGSYGAGFLVLDSLDLRNAGGRAFLKNKMEIPVPLRPHNSAFQLRLENAKFQDFAGNLKRSVNNLRFETNGNVQVRLDFQEGAGKVKLGGLSLKPDLNIKDLELNNQIWKAARPYKRIFKVQPFRLLGNVDLKGGELNVYDTSFAFPSGTMEVSGKHTSAGYDLKGVAKSINAGAEVGEISSIPISGEGGLGIYVHGPDDAVKIDFELNQKNASFVHFDFGNIEGKVVYDDKNDTILIPGVNGLHGSAKYSVSGVVELGAKESISLEAQFEDSRPDDVFAIFAHQLRKITWIPYGMGGLIRGKVKVGGKYSDGLNTLEIDSYLKGSNLIYWGELLQELDAHAGVSRGVVFARDVVGKKYQTSITGSVEYNLRTDEMAYILDAPKGKLRSLDFLSSIEVPLDGLYRFHSEGRGRWETLVSKTKFDAYSAFLRTRPLPPLILNLETGADSTTYNAQLGESANWEMRISEKGESFSRISLQRANLDFLLCFISKSNCNDPVLNFTASVEGRSSWLGRNWKLMSGTGSLNQVELSKTGYSLRLPGTVAITAKDGLLQSGSGILEGEDSKLEFRLRGMVDGSEIENRLKGSLSLKFLEFLTPLIEEGRGKMRLNLGLEGEVRDAAFSGNINIEDGLLRVKGLDAPVEAIDAKLTVKNSHLSIDSLNGQLGGGSARASGGIELYLNRPPKFAIDLYLANNRIKFFPINYAEISDAKFSFTGESPPYLFSGTARAKKVMMRNNFNLSRGKGLQNAKYLPEKLAGAKAFYEVRLKGVADGGIFVENDLLNAEFKGEVTLMNNFEFPQIVGRAELVRGKLLFRNTSFALDFATIRLPNPEVFNPQFSIGGKAGVDSYQVNLFASGTVDRPKISLTSYPALSQEDIVSLLAFGYRGEDTRHVNQSDTTAITYSEVGSILMEQLQLSQNLQSKGLKVTVAPSVTDNEAALIRPNSAVAAAPKVYVQSQVAKNLEATLGGTVGAVQGQTMDAKVEYRLNRRASVRGVYEQSSSGLDANETKNSYGADLRFRWEFK